MRGHCCYCGKWAMLTPADPISDVFDLVDVELPRDRRRMLCDLCLWTWVALCDANRADVLEGESSSVVSRWQEWIEAGREPDPLSLKREREALEVELAKLRGRIDSIEELEELQGDLESEEGWEADEIRDKFRMARLELEELKRRRGADS